MYLQISGALRVKPYTTPSFFARNLAWSQEASYVERINRLIKLDTVFALR